MTLAECIAYYRRRVRDLDSTAYTQTDEEVAAGLESSRRQLAAKRVPNMDTIAIDSEAVTMTGGLTDELGYLVGTHAAWMYLSDEYHRKLSSGAFGIVWKSGLEEENSLQASQAYKLALEGLFVEWGDWILVINRDTFALRIQ